MLRFSLLCFLVFAVAACDSTPEDRPVGIEDIVVGTGKVAGVDSTVIITYDGLFEDGTPFVEGEVFDEPALVSSLLQGLVEGIPGTRVGGNRRLTIPPEKAFGSSGLIDQFGVVIVPGGATVIFDLVLEHVGERFVQIEELVVGSGSEANVGDQLLVNYTGTLENGSTFDSGMNFTVGALTEANVIAGWVEGVEGMKVGGTRRIVIPPEKAYSSRGAFDGGGNQIVPPGATLTFVIDLLQVNGAG